MVVYQTLEPDFSQPYKEKHHHNSTPFHQGRESSFHPTTKDVYINYLEMHKNLTIIKEHTKFSKIGQVSTANF
jgi:hypothetical protein